MWWIFLGWHLLGIFVGSFFTALYCKRKNNYLKAGTIRLDQSTDEPYLFLELNQGGTSKINTEKEIILDVEIKNYISQ